MSSSNAIQPPSSTPSGGSVSAPFGYCRHCHLSLGQRYELVETVDSELACPQCGQVDTSATWRKNSVADSTSRGAVLDDNEMIQTMRNQWNHFDTGKEKSYKDYVDSLFRVYLQDLDTCLLDELAPQLVRGAKLWYLELRKAEKDPAGDTDSTSYNYLARRVKYQIVAAIKLTVQETNLAYVNHQLDRSTNARPAVVRGTGQLRSPPLWELFSRSRRKGSASPGYLDSLSYLHHVHRKACQSAKRNLSPVDGILCLVLQATRRLKFLASLPHDERLKHLRTKPLRGMNKHRDWYEEDWTWFETSKLDWQKVLQVAFGLYQAQQCVWLWTTSTNSPQVAIALCFWACMAAATEIMPQYSHLMREIAAWFDQKQHVASERMSEMKNLIVAWSTSISDIGLPMPQLNPPRTGGIGDGFRGYGSDSRRPIPELEIAVVAARVIADHWREIMHARLRTRTAARTMDDELADARRKCAAAGMRLTKRPQSSPSHVTYSTSTSSPVPSGGTQSRGVTPAAPRPMTQSTFVPPPEPTIEELLAVHDDSSAYDSDSSHDGDVSWHTLPPRVFAEGLKDIDRQSGPISFELGNGTFKIHRQEDSTTDETVPSTSKVTRVLNPAIGPSSMTMSRNQSESSLATSDLGGSSASAPGVRRTPQTSNTSVAGSDKSITGRSVSAVPSSAPSPATTAGSIPMSPTLSTTPLREITSIEDPNASHVGVLIREREYYLAYKLNAKRHRGEIVSEEIEKEMVRWISQEKTKGTIPQVIRDSYLTDLGINGSTDRDDYGPYIKSKRGSMSPLEALLRAGVKPIVLPQHYIVHSIAQLHRELHFDDDPKKPSELAPVGQRIDSKELDAELALLFPSNGVETISDLFNNPSQIGKRRKLLVENGAWDFVPKPEGSRRGKKKEQRGYVSRLAENIGEIMAGESKTDEGDEAEGDEIVNAYLASLIENPISAEDGGGEENESDEERGGGGGTSVKKKSTSKGVTTPSTTTKSASRKRGPKPNAIAASTTNATPRDSSDTARTLIPATPTTPTLTTSTTTATDLHPSTCTAAPMKRKAPGGGMITPMKRPIPKNVHHSPVVPFSPPPTSRLPAGPSPSSLPRKPPPRSSIRLSPARLFGLPPTLRSDPPPADIP